MLTDYATKAAAALREIERSLAEAQNVAGYWHEEYNAAGLALLEERRRYGPVLFGDPQARNSPAAVRLERAEKALRAANVEAGRLAKLRDYWRRRAGSTI